MRLEEAIQQEALEELLAEMQHVENSNSNDIKAIFVFFIKT